MDKFTKTTEIDISAMTEMEDETPKKSNVGNVIAFISCLIFAIVIWLFVMEIDTSLQEREYNDISVEKIGDAGYTVSGNLNVDVVLKGINKELADIDKDDIRVVLDFSKIKNIDEVEGREQEYSVDVILPDNAGESVQSQTTNVKITINKASWEL